jgi:hypothetical protein
MPSNSSNVGLTDVPMTRQAISTWPYVWGVLVFWLRRAGTHTGYRPWHVCVRYATYDATPPPEAAAAAAAGTRNPRIMRRRHLTRQLH